MTIEPLNIPFMSLESHHCREVIGTGEDGLALYCGHPQKRYSSYCPHHSAINEVVGAPKRPQTFARNWKAA